MRHIFIALVIGIAGLITFLSVRPSPSGVVLPDPPPVLTDTLLREQIGICIWDKAGLRKSPGKKGDYLTPVVFGERVTLLGEQQEIASEDRTYIKIRLSDDQEGWVNQYLFAENASLAVVMGPTKIFRRPDVMTLKEETLERGEIVAATEVIGNWLKVIGEERKKSGWVQAIDNLSTYEDDILVAQRYQAAMKKGEPYAQRKALQTLVDDFGASGSSLMKDVRTSLEQAGLVAALPEDELYITSPDVSLRSEPTTEEGLVLRALEEGSICKVINVGEKASIGELNDYWYKIRFQGESGWVFGHFTSRKLTD